LIESTTAQALAIAGAMRDIATAHGTEPLSVADRPES
jgi:hypothetical protein